jgi:hypothetical protein
LKEPAILSIRSFLLFQRLQTPQGSEGSSGARFPGELFHPLSAASHELLPQSRVGDETFHRRGHLLHGLRIKEERRVTSDLW